ncbi:hypothetical protein [Stackebrandtia nassauensis]|uniref:SalK n=1 Tax=Stackebrandtia nassauensis (strain DSM 44728 / CIP 108903 / NRRL B-16338 / NBRC 102104 / LLR-40K-21) TaxID=446470 RepID=D3PY79_STANL|nr:hypothetical protein [Stackebrandtia nassauensis]ADD41446.1 hypothetical protein Snas_1748 [Stackebrandtia nassauensis DSM 44728]
MNPPSYAARIRPVIDRVYTGLRRAAMPRQRAVYEKFGATPGFESSFYFGLLARPMSAAGFAAATTYSGADMTGEREQGVATVDDDGNWGLTERGRELALAVQWAVADGAEEAWGQTPIATMPGLSVVPRLAELVGRLLDAGRESGGPAFRALTPVFEPADATPSLLLASRLGALRHHRGDAHRAAWQGRGLSLDELRELSGGAQRQAIEDETDRLDAPIYAVLTADERLELLAGLGALPG